MAEDFIEEIYEKSNIISLIQKMSINCRRRKDILVKEQWKICMQPLTKWCNEIISSNVDIGKKVWDLLQDIRRNLEKAQYGEAADRLERVSTCLYSCMENEACIDVEEGRYRIYSTLSGYLNIQDIVENVKYYSEINPIMDRYELAKELYIPSMRAFIVIGCGLGYLPWQMYEVANQGVDIYVVDVDSTMISYAINYGALSYIPKEQLHIIEVESTYEALVECETIVSSIGDEACVLYIEDFFYRSISNTDKCMLAKIRSTIQTNINFGDICEQNHFRNSNSVKKKIDDIDWSAYSNQWIIVGGGPSVDDNLEYLKEQKGKKVIIAASTVYKKLLNEAIEPDIVAVLDPQNRTYKHFEGIETLNTNAILIVGDTANWKFGEYYEGDKYIVTASKKYYSDLGNVLSDEVNVQSTVTAFAIEIAVYAGAISIELVGMDLAYPNGDSHATGTMDRAKVDVSGLEMVPSVDGGRVYTSGIFKLYIEDVEKQIEKYNKIDFYNLSRHGAYIKGCRKLC